jgi:hypothetical protein
MIALTVSFFSLHRIIIEAITGASPDDIIEPAYQMDRLSKSNPKMHTLIFKDQTEVDAFLHKMILRKEFSCVVCQRDLADL